MRISKEFTWEAAHWLPRHPGKCSRLHGHSYKAKIELEGPVNKESQFVLDYGDLTSIVEPIIERWDHRVMNSFVRYSSAENIAVHLADLLRPKLGGELNQLIVAVSETGKTWAVWDSSNREDIDLLDKAPMDAEWRSPKVDIPLPANEDEVHSILLFGHISEGCVRINALLKELNEELAKQSQYQLYLDSLVDAQNSEQSSELNEEVQ